MPYQRRAKIMNNHTFFFFKVHSPNGKISGIRLIYRMPMHFFNYYFRTTTIYTDPRRIRRIKPSPQRNPKKYPHAPPRQTDIGVRKAYSQQNYILNEIPHQKKSICIYTRQQSALKSPHKVVFSRCKPFLHCIAEN